MELTDYDILGITQQDSFRIVKNAYYDLSRIYHPDSTTIIIGLSKQDKIIAFQRVQKAYENIKDKMNIVEIDLPQEEILYNDSKFDKPVIMKNNKLHNMSKEEFHKNFNIEFEKLSSEQNIDNPYSIHYKEPDESERNLLDSKIILKESCINKSSNVYEFGINYIEDHSCKEYSDIRNLNNSNNLDTKSIKDDTKSIKDDTESIKDDTESIKESIDKDLDEKLEELVKMRNIKIELSEDDIEFINRQKHIKIQIQERKRIINENRNKLYLN